MKASLIALLLFTTSLFASDLEIKVERRTLEREDRALNRPKKQMEEHTIVFRVSVKNTSGKALPAGKVDWSTLVLRGGTRENSINTGTEPLAALKNGEVATFDTAAVSILTSPRSKQDTEYKIVVSHDGKTTATSVSTEKFDALAGAAKEERRHRRK